ncbi:hypothetical protein [Vreelandella populi]|uniref:Uncharacterized protein n=1 Tax=Vreelandella populi TaxID=2498858 RepID=A0A433LG36_9GAMM|nr:hypothetical protein [Halomonas populi]RUR48833.1 hypothetical protein ELY37_02995 [Halomonas populi]
MSEREKKLRFYATAPKAGAKKIHRFINGDFVPFWVATLRGKAVTLDSGRDLLTRDEAINEARAFRQSCRDDLAKIEGDP